jgi:hypothetical protein
VIARTTLQSSEDKPRVNPLAGVETRQLNRVAVPITSARMSTVQEIESALRQLRPDEMRAVRDWIDEILEDQLEFTPEFAAKIARSEQEMAQGLKPRTRQP